MERVQVRSQSRDFTSTQRQHMNFDDSLIPASHSRVLFNAFSGRKEMVIIGQGSHNDLHTFKRYEDFLANEVHVFFNPK